MSCNIPLVNTSTHTLLTQHCQPWSNMASNEKLWYCHAHKMLLSSRPSAHYTISGCVRDQPGLPVPKSQSLLRFLGCKCVCKCCKWPNKRPGRVGVQAGASIYEAFILITSAKIPKEFKSSAETPLHQLIRLGRLEIYIAPSNPNICQNPRSLLLCCHR